MDGGRCSAERYVDWGEPGGKMRSSCVWKWLRNLFRALTRQPNDGARFELGFMEIEKEKGKAFSGGERGRPLTVCVLFGNLVK